MSNLNYPRIGVGVIVLNAEGHVLLGLRHGSHGANTWAMPGGAVERGESLLTAAARELREETGIESHIMEMGPTMAHPYIDDKGTHWVTSYVVACNLNGPTPQVIEPDKHLEWRFWDWEALPDNIFYPLQQLMDDGWQPAQPHWE